MSLVIIILLLAYTLFVYYIARWTVVFHEEQAEMQALKAKEVYHKYLLQEDYVLLEKTGFEEDFRELYALYDMTKEITKSFSNEEAMQIFCDKLKAYTAYEECYLLEPLSPEVTKAKKHSQCTVFPLKGKHAFLGYIVIRGADQEDFNKIEILVNQFALVLRRIHLYQEVERLAITDGLTQVFTRRYIMDRFNEELRRARLKDMRLSFLMLDVDLFKHINDQHGHLVGDSVLREVAHCIMENVREIDIVGRYGGEEFCMVLPETDTEGALYVAQRVRKAMEKKIVKAYDASVKATVSIGIASFPKDGKKMATLIDKADWALYRAKKNGRNQVCVFGMGDD